MGVVGNSVGKALGSSGRGELLTSNVGLRKILEVVERKGDSRGEVG